MSAFDFISKFILFAIPGFITVTMFFYLTGKETPDKIISIFQVFLSSILSCVGANAIIYIGNHLFDGKCPYIAIAEILSGNQYSLTTSGLVWAIAVSVILGLFATAIAAHNLIFKLANKLHITYKVDNTEVWDSLFDGEPWVVVRDNVSEHIYRGQVIQYSDKSHVREILLRNVHVFNEKDDYWVEEVYLSRNPSEFSIEIGKYKEKEESHE